MSQLLDLPIELLDQILGLITRRDVSSLSRCNRTLYWVVSNNLFNLAFQLRSKILGPKPAFTHLFYHATKHDSANIVQWLIFRGYGSLLNGFVPGIKHVTHLHCAILHDAPRLATHLVKHGTYIYDGEHDYPDLTPLCLTICRPQNYVDGRLDDALRIACSYALPRTTRFLLTRGADTNALGKYGFASVHKAMARRLPWRNFSKVSAMHGNYDSEDTWNSMVFQTVAVLLDFGGDPNLQSTTSRTHSCGYKCWRSVDCDHRSQRPLHLSSASGNKQVVSLLLDRGARPDLIDGDGNIPLFPAMTQGNYNIAVLLLASLAGAINPVVSQYQKSTALHIACRFPLPKLVLDLLRRGADANVTDSLGQTPLHEALGQESPDIADAHGKTARILAASHGNLRVREMFQPVTTKVFQHSKRLSKHRQKGYPRNSRTGHTRTKQAAITDVIAGPSSVGPRGGYPDSENLSTSPWFDENVMERVRANKQQHKSKADEGDRKTPTVVENCVNENLSAKTPAARFWGAMSERVLQPAQLTTQSCEKLNGESESGNRRGKKARKGKWTTFQLS